MYDLQFKLILRFLKLFFLSFQLIDIKHSFFILFTLFDQYSWSHITNYNSRDLRVISPTPLAPTGRVENV